MSRNVVNLPLIVLEAGADVFFRVGQLVTDAEVPVYSAQTGGTLLNQPVSADADGKFTVYTGQDYDGDIWIHYGSNTPYNSSIFRIDDTAERPYRAKGSSEPVYDFGTLNPDDPIAIDLENGNSQIVTLATSGTHALSYAGFTYGQDSFITLEITAGATLPAFSDSGDGTAAILAGNVDTDSVNYIQVKSRLGNSSIVFFKGTPLT